MSFQDGSVHIGALHAESWSGLVLSPGPGEGFGFRFAVEKETGDRADQMDLFWLVHEVGAHAPDGRYARVSFDLDLPFGLGGETPLVLKADRRPGMILEWSRVGDQGVLGRVTTDYDGTLDLIPFFPWDWMGEWSDLPPGVGSTDEAGVLGVTGSGRTHAAILTRPARLTVGEGPSPVLRFPAISGTRLEFAAALGQGPEGASAAARQLLTRGVGPHLARAREEYENARIHVDGPWAGLAASVTNNLHWMVLLKPEAGELYVPAGRRWIFPAPNGSPDHWTVFGWDSYFNALELALESEELAMTAVRAGLATQYPSGCIPNWRGRFGGTPDRSQPPVGSLAMAKLLARFGNQDAAREALPALEAWTEFWRTEKEGHPRRDGNDDGLFEWGSDAADISPTPPPWEVEASGWQRAAWESGQDDLPNWEEASWVDESETFDLGCVDLNSYLALDLECLAWMNRELGMEGRARELEGAWTRLRDRMNETLWDENRGMYLDRRWSGEWSPRVAASNFLPLVAGVPDPHQARRMMETLTDPQWFWGDFVLPTISRNDPAFVEQQYWRGTIWPPMNYLVYQGIKRYGFDEIAGELAQRSVALFLRSWRDYQLCRENYDSRTGEGGGQRYQSWGPLFALIGLEEFLDVTPWAGLTVGSLAPPGDTTARRLGALGRSWDVTLGPGGLRLSMDGRVLISTAEPVVLRRVQVDEGGLSFDLHSLRPTEVRVEHPPAPGEASVDGRPVRMDDRRIQLPAGRHHVQVARQGNMG